MKTYKGPEVIIEKAPEIIFNFLSDFKHFQKFLPEQISEWEATDNYCAFAIQGMGKIKLEYQERLPFSKIVIQPASDSGFPIPFFLKCFMNNADELNEKTQFQFVVEASVNPMLSMMVDRPLQQFVNIITERLQQYFAN